MTAEERTIADKLCRCRFVAGSWQKRFVRFIASHPDCYVLTPHQVDLLWRIAASWKRQLLPKDRTLIPPLYRGGLTMTEMLSGELPKQPEAELSNR